jgi:hypothetical protein
MLTPSNGRGVYMYTMLTCTHLICPANAACAALNLELNAARARSLRSRWGVELSRCCVELMRLWLKKCCADVELD